MVDKPISVAETPLFVRQAEKVWSDEEREEFIDFISKNPESGDLIQDTGGVRKIRWRRAGTSKRDGVRIIYFYYSTACPIFLLMVYAKSMQADLSPEGKKAAKEIATAIKQRYRH